MDTVIVTEKKELKAKVEFTTFRLFAEDGEALSDLASLERKTIAEIYRELCAPIIHKRLMAKTEEKLKRLKKTD